MKIKLRTALVRQNADETFSQYSDGDEIEFDDNAEALRYIEAGLADRVESKTAQVVNKIADFRAGRGESKSKEDAE